MPDRPVRALIFLRARLALWSVLVTGVSVLLFGAYVYRELDEIQRTAADPSLGHAATQELLVRMLLAAPVILLVAAVGGLFLASRALAPVEAIVRTATAITATDLARRIRYAGPLDEIGQLAATIDQMLDRLQAAFERERRFTADASHELRTPLTSMKGRIGVTLGRPRGVEDYASALREIDRDVDRLIPLTNALLFLARFDHQRLAAEIEMVELSDLLDAVLEQTRLLAAERGVRLESAIEAGLVVRGVPSLLISLVVNLLDNALKYTSPGGRVTVRAERAGREIEVAVSDTGPGISPEEAAHLFEPFYRTAVDRSRATGGAGLGLTIAQEIARFHRAALSVRSVPGEGSTFALRFPADEADGPPVPPPPQ